LFATWTWSTSNAEGISIGTMKINPNSFFNIMTRVNTSHTLTASVGPPIFYLSRLFNFWRGGIRFTIKIPKTIYHIGRLQVTFTPNTGVTNTPSVLTSVVSLREIIDVRTGDEFSFTLPWLLAVNYLNQNEYSGQLDVIVLNALKAPDAASQSLDLLLFVSGADDFEFQVPVGDLSIAPQMPQWASLEAGEIVSEVIGHSGDGNNAETPSVESIGEHFLSVRQLLLRPSLFQRNVSATFTRTMVVYPWSSTGVFNAGTSSLGYPLAGGHMYSYISAMYAFYRGGMRVLINASGVANYPQMAGTFACNFPYASAVDTACISNGSSLSAVTPWTSTNNGSPAIIAYGQIPAVTPDSTTGTFSVSLPYYCKTKVSLVIPQTQNSLPAAQISDDQPTSAAYIYNPVASSTFFGGFNCATSIAEDFQFSYFIGCPPVFVSLA